MSTSHGHNLRRVVKANKWTVCYIAFMVTVLVALNLYQIYWNS